VTLHYPTGDQLDAAKTLEQRFRMLDQARQTRLDMCQEMASFTIPRMYPPDGETSETHQKELLSSHPARLIFNLAAKLTAAVFPANSVPFFNFGLPELNNPDPVRLQKLKNQVLKVELHLMNRLRSSNFREALQTFFEQVISFGDSLLYQGDNYDFRVYRLDQFVIRRDAAGNIAEIMVRDWLEPDLLPDELRNINDGKPASEDEGKRGRLEPAFTHLQFNVDTQQWDVRREFRKKVYEEDVSYDINPYLHVGWARIFTEDYSRSLVEDNMGTIRSLEYTEKALVEAVAAGSRGHMGIDPTGLTKVEDVEDQPNWAFVSARQQDIFSIQAEVGGHLTVAQLYAEKLKQELADAFLANQATQLTGERVTAYQVQEALAEIQQALGGVLGQVAANIQEPVIRRALQIEAEKGTLSADDLQGLDQMDLQVKTGLDALGRQLEGARLQSALAQIGQVPEWLATIDPSAVVREVFTTSGLDWTQYEKKPEQQQAEQQAALQQQAQQQAISTAGNVVEQAARQG
jgi:hypothetical protein